MKRLARGEGECRGAYGLVRWPIVGWLLRTAGPARPGRQAKFQLNPPIAQDFDQRTDCLVVGNSESVKTPT
jgi:hypothetical protein